MTTPASFCRASHPATRDYIMPTGPHPWVLVQALACGAGTPQALGRPEGLQEGMPPSLQGGSQELQHVRKRSAGEEPASKRGLE